MPAHDDRLRSGNHDEHGGTVPVRMQSRTQLSIAFALVAGCASGDMSGDESRLFELDRVEIERDDDTAVLIGFDPADEPISRATLRVDDRSGAVAFVHDEEVLTVTISPIDGGVTLTYDRGPWRLAWNPNADEPLDESITAAWNPAVLAWRDVLLDGEAFDPRFGAALNVELVDPPPEAREEAWPQACSTVVRWQCAATPVAVVLACGLAGTAYCEALRDEE